MPRWRDPIRHSGVVIVCGSAFSLLDDYRKARARYPAAPVIAAKNAAWHVRAFALFSLHPGRFPGMVEGQRRIHREFTTHLGGRIRDHTNMGLEKTFEPDFYWPEITGGSSGWAARKLAAAMGFDIVVLCGVPLSKGGYVNGPSKVFQDNRIIERYRREVMEDTEYHHGVISMSGFTRELFGETL